MKLTLFKIHRLLGSKLRLGITFVLISLLTASITSQAGTLRYTYDAAGRITGVDYGNSTNTTYTYDNNGNVIEEMTASATDANLSLSKSAPAGPVAAGLPLAYTLTITNNGPHAASAVTLTDTLPFGVSLKNVFSSQGVCTSLGQTVTCHLGVIAPGAIALVNIEVTPAFGAVFTNNASVALAQLDSAPGDNSDDAVTTVTSATDSDGDGLPDWWEELHFGGVTNADKSADSDLDGITDGDEYASDTDPHDQADYLAVVDALRTSITRLDWNSSPIRSYSIQYTASPVDSAAWSNLITGIEGTGQVLSGTDTNAVVTQRTYRIEAVVP